MEEQTSDRLEGKASAGSAVTLEALWSCNGDWVPGTAAHSIRVEGVEYVLPERVHALLLRVCYGNEGLVNAWRRARREAARGKKAHDALMAVLERLRGQATLTLHIEKRGYSVDPWRLVDGEGREVVVPGLFEHPDLGRTVVEESIRGATRKACEAAALALLAHHVARCCQDAPGGSSGGAAVVPSDRRQRDGARLSS